MNRIRTGLAVFASLAVVDVVGVVGVFVDDGPPWYIAVGSALLGLITLVGLVPAWRGRLGALMTVLATRTISALVGISAFFAPQAPGWAKIATGAFIALTLAAVALTADALRAVGAVRQWQ
jgi:hypothetical protein